MVIFLLLLSVFPLLLTQCVSKKVRNKKSAKKLEEIAPKIHQRGANGRRMPEDLSTMTHSPVSKPDMSSKPKTPKEVAEPPKNEQKPVTEKSVKKQVKAAVNPKSMSEKLMEGKEKDKEENSEEKKKTQYKTAEEKSVPTRGKKMKETKTDEQNVTKTQEEKTRTQSATKPKVMAKKGKVEEYMESQGEDDTLKCVKSISNEKVD